MGHSRSLNARRTFVALLIIAGGMLPAAAAVEGAAITVGISEDAKKQFAAQLSIGQRGFLTIDYFVRRGASLLEIFPQLVESAGEKQQISDYLEALATAKPLKYNNGLNVSFPALDIRIVNNSSKPLLFTRATIAVSESFIDPTPLLFVQSSPNMFEFGIDNEGWGPVEQCRIQFNLDNVERNRVPEVFTFERTFGRFDSGLTVRVDEELQRSGIPKEYVTGWRDVTDHNEWYNNKSQTDRAKKLRAMLPEALREEGAYLSGVITYSWRNAKGQIEQRRNPFFCGILLQPPEYGAEGPITGKYEAMLRSQGRNYEVTVPISQSVPKNGGTRFALRIGGPCSSFHEMKLKLQSTTGEILESEPFKLTVSLPRSSAVQARAEGPKK